MFLVTSIIQLNSPVLYFPIEVLLIPGSIYVLINMHEYWYRLCIFVGSDWCPKIYFNHLCFSGGFLSKGRIAELPRSVGPGPVSLVMKEVGHDYIYFCAY